MDAERGWAQVLLAAALLAAPLAWARDGVEVGGNSAFSKLVPAESVEQTARAQYQQTLQQANQQQALAPANHPQLLRLRRIAARIIPFTADWNPRAKDWQWQVNLIGSNQINAWCMPGGKIAFYTGILDTLKLTDDEVAAVMGHEIAHALREHARERMGKSVATNLGANLLSQWLGAGQLGNTVIGGGAQLLSLQFSRSDESEADLVGLELAARAGFDPRAGITLWQKMAAQNKGAPPQWLSTHPAGSTRIAEMQKNLPRVLPLYEQAKKS
ncbi:M48 family metallopeptidase [Rhodoferax sp. WC2427]|uniref:M48 family metallopeptidase n=1 Tax=Rhodoferax sp. WC2427 TaxID=3234144 RepID=UPI003464F9C9